MPRKFCPKCGKETGPFHEGFCVVCFTQDHPGLADFDNIVVEQCPQCFRIRDNKSWVSADSMGDFIKSKMKTKLSDPKVKLELLKSDSKKAFFKATVSGKLGRTQFTLEREFLVKFKKDQCPVCGKKQSTFHAAKIQLRGDHEGVLRQMFNVVRNENRAYIAKDRDAEIFRFEEVKGGYDIYLGSAKAAKQCAKALHKFKPEIKETYKLVGMERHTNKKKYKVTYSVRL